MAETPMKVQGKAYRTIWLADDGWAVEIIDQTKLPHEFTTRRLETLHEAAHAISAMRVRGAPLIGATAAFGLALAMRRDASDAALAAAYERLVKTRPTAVNLRWALDDVRALLALIPEAERAAAAYRRAGQICDEDVENNRAIGAHGLRLLREIAAAKVDGEGRAGPVNVLTHCNAGWLATVDWGTALAPVYAAHDSGLAVHVWVAETRPRNQGSGLTAWELAEHGVPHTVVVDSAGGHLMQRGLVDVCMTGSDRATATGDVCNKIGTYQKALAASDNGVPFYAALPGSSIDWTLSDGLREIPIEERDGGEVATVTGRDAEGRIATVAVTPEGTPVFNPGFDVTPARLVTGLITERGVAPATREGLLSLYPEAARARAGRAAG
jgi:methylthioribose-1-phosphate isomerase